MSLLFDMFGFAACRTIDKASIYLQISRGKMAKREGDAILLYDMFCFAALALALALALRSRLRSRCRMIDIIGSVNRYCF